MSNRAARPLLLLCTQRHHSLAVGASSLPEVKSFESIPGPKPLPLVGNIWRYLPIVGDYKPENLFENALYNRQRYGPIVREQITKNHTILHLFDPDYIQSFFRQDAMEAHRRSHRALLKYRRETPSRYQDGGLFPENGPSWARLRGLFQHRMMNKSQIAIRTPILDGIAMDFVERLKQVTNNKATAKVERFERLLYRWAITCSLSIFLDFDVDRELEDGLIERLIGSLHKELEAIDWTEIKSEKWSRSPSKCPYFQQLKNSEEFLYDFVAGRIDQLMRNNSFRDVSLLRELLVDDQLERRDVITMVIDNLLAGLHTLTYVTTFLLENISRSSSELREVLRCEIDSQLKGAAPIESYIYDELPILKGCLRETLRVNPVSIGTGRLTQSDDMVIAGYRIPKDIMVIIQTQAVCRDPKVFENPDTFLPDRWDRYRAKPREQRPSPFAWLPFGFGPRACIGQRLATLEMYSLVARLLQSFEVEFQHKIKTKTTLIHNIDGNVAVELRKIK